MKLTRIEEMRRIVEDFQAFYVDGMLVDVLSATAYIKVHDACDEVQKEGLAALSLNRAMEVVWRIIRK